MDLSIVIPVYNEEEALPDLICELKRMKLTQFNKFEVIFVNDHSSDRSFEILSRFCATDSEQYRLLNSPINIGYGAAISYGVREARLDWILTMDSDGQHKIADIETLVKEIPQYDFVIGSRTGQDRSWRRNVGKVLVRKFAEFICGDKIPDLNSGFRLLRRSYFMSCNPFLPEGYSLSTTLTLFGLFDGLRVKFVPIPSYERVGGQSRVRYISDGIGVLLLITRIVTFFRPMKIFLFATVNLFSLGLLLLTVNLYVYHRISNGSVLLFIGGLLFFLLGLIAEQLAAIIRAQRIAGK